MYSKIVFSEFFQADLFQTSMKTDFAKTGLHGIKGAENTNFTDFLRKFQEKDFAFVDSGLSDKGKGSLKGFGSEDLNDVFDSLESKEKLIGMVVDRMKQVLRQASDSSSFLNFQSTEITAFRQVMISAGTFSGEEIDGILDKIKSKNGEYLPDLISSLEELKPQEMDVNDVYFPFSFVPYFETALQSIDIKSSEIKDSIETSLDIETGFSLGKFLSSLKDLKNEAETMLPTLKGDEFESVNKSIKGLETIISVFEIPEENQAGFINFDKKSFENLINSIEKKILSGEMKKDRDIYQELLMNSAGKGESSFVSNLLNESQGASGVINPEIEKILSGEVFQDSFLSWKRRERVFAEKMMTADQDDISVKHFENSSEYSLFTKLSSVELDLENYFSGGNRPELNSNIKDLLSSLEGEAGIEGFSEELLNGDELENHKGFKTLLEKSVDKNSGIEGGEDGIELNGRNSTGRSESGGGPESAKESKSPLSRHVMNQVEKQVLRTVRVGEKEMSFRLNPPDLGKMHLRLENLRNGINIKIIAEKSSTHEILLQQAQDFKQQLQSQGMQVAEVNVELAHDFDQAMARERRNESNGSKGGKKSFSGKNSGGVDTSDNNPEAGVVKRSTGNSALDLMA